MMNLFDSI